MSNPVPVYVMLECSFEDAAAREAALHAFEGYPQGDDADVRNAHLHAHGVDVDTPFSLGTDWSVESADATTDGAFRLAIESRDAHSDDFIESFLLVAAALGGEEISADVIGGAGDDVHLHVMDGGVVYDIPDSDDVHDDESFDEVELEEAL